MTNAERMLSFAREQLGELYDIGDHGPDLWDCSGLTMEMVELMGLKWSHSSHYQYYDNIKANGDFSAYGPIDTLPLDKFAFLFKYGERSSGKGKGMIHVGVYTGSGTQIQAGGNGKKVTLENGKRKSTVSEDAFTPSYWDYWAHVKGQDNEVDAQADTANETTPETGYKTLCIGNTGEQVKVLQNLLNQRGEDLTVDGKFGPLTFAAVKAFQALNGLDIDGIVGPITWAALLADDPAEIQPDETPEAEISLLLSGLTAEQADEVRTLAGQYTNVTLEQQG